MEISMNFEKLVIFMGVLFPLTFSPGPADVTIAAVLLLIAGESLP